ncbi:hypothetical protein ACVWW9_002519 [Agrococcus sp. UYP33]
MRDAVVEPTPASPPHAAHPVAAAAIGALVGLTWAAALRAYMVTIAGPGSSFTWWTLVAILLPGAIAGACIGVAHARRTRGRAWLLGFAPFAFTALTMLEPGALTALVTTGIGGGAIAVPAALVLGGFGLGTIGPRAARIPCLVLAVLLAAGFAAAVPLAGGSAVAATTARGAWAILLAAGLLLTGMLGTALAFRRDRRA